MEDRILKFVMALRASGIRISLAESTDAFKAIQQLGVKDREVFRLSLQATLIKDAESLATFDELFPLFFGGEGGPPLMDPTQDLTEDEARMLAEALRDLSQQLRSMMERMIRGQEFNPQELEKLADMVGMPMVSDLRYRDWMVRRMKKALQFDEVRAALEELMAILAEMGMDPDRLEQFGMILGQNQQALEEQLRQYAGSRIAEQMIGEDPQEGIEGLMNRPFNTLSEKDMQRLRKEVSRLARLLKTRVALRRRRAKSGQLDAKATIRANLKHGNIPIKIIERARQEKPKLVVICDISTSMRPMSELMLSLIYELQDQISKTHAFAFIDHLEYISPDFALGDPKKAVNQVMERMPSGYYNTDLGYSLQNFARDWMDTVDSRATFILVGDGRNNYNNPRLDIFGKIARRSNRTIWINPEPRALWGTGDSDMLEYEPHCSQVMLVRNLAELTRAVDLLLA